MTDDFVSPKPFAPDENHSAAEGTQKKEQPELKDYFCPYCGFKLFRGNVNEFKMVCLECNKLVNSNDLKEPPDQE